MFASIRKKFCAALVGSLMFFVPPSCQAGVAAGVTLITGGIVPTLFGFYKTIAGIILFKQFGMPNEVMNAQIINNIGSGVSFLGLGTGAIVAGAKLIKTKF